MFDGHAAVIGDAPHPRQQASEAEVDDRRRVQRQELAQQQAADDGHAERPAQFRPGAGTERQRQRAQQGGHGRHHDRPIAQPARLTDGFLGRASLVAFGVQREVHHHDGVLLHDADQQDDADQRDQIQVLAAQHQGKQRAHARRRQC